MFFVSILFDIVVFGILIPTLFVIISRSLDKVFLFSQFDFIFLKISGVLSIFLGLIFIVRSYYLIIKVGRGYTLEFFNISFLPVTKKLIKVGPYSATRHPMVFGYLVGLSGIIFIIGSLSGLIIMLPLVSALIVLYLIFFEEKALYDRFGAEFKEYKSNTGFIIPSLKKWRSKNV